MDKILSQAARDRKETFATAQRIYELALFPVKGNFDAAHLREVNRRIFQDLPNAGFTDVTPGAYRPELPKGEDWIKNRVLETAKGVFTAAYSNMDEQSQKRLDKALEQVDIPKFHEMSDEEFSKTITHLYAELDYIHPFKDGNSRTLREFTSQIANESGFELDWQRFDRSPADRDALYVARDLSVNALAAPHIQSDYTMQRVLETHAKLKTNRNLHELMRDAVSRIRDVKEYLAKPHIDKLAHLLAENNPSGDNLSRDALVEKFKLGLGTLFQQGKEISPLRVEEYQVNSHAKSEQSPQKSFEVER